jgi:hypothetical protein
MHWYFEHKSTVLYPKSLISAQFSYNEKQSQVKTLTNVFMIFKIGWFEFDGFFYVSKVNIIVLDNFKILFIILT